MPSRRTVNVGLLLALSTVLLIILHHSLLQSAGQAEPARTSEGEWAQYEGQPVNLDPDVIPVVVCAVEERLGGAIATINSVRIHTNARLVFYIVTLRHTIPHITTWIKESVLENINYFIIEFNPDIVRGKIPVIAERPELLSPLNFARFYLGHLIPQHKRAVYLDDDIIVLGDIRELFESPLQDGHAAAFSDDCDAISTHLLANLRGIVVQNMYMAYLNYNKESVSKLGIRGSSCTFNPGVVVANLTEWRRQRISEQLEQWLMRDQEEHLYSSSVADGVATPPMLIVFHRRHSSLPPAWHVRYLGYSAAIRFSTAVMGEAKLLHWNGPFKPWGRTSSYTELWEEWYIPDPTGTFRPLSASFRNA